MSKSAQERSDAMPPQSRSPRGRPTRDRVAAIEANILSAARTTFLAHGFSGASMDQVAQLAQVSKSTLYGRYPDKSSLFEAVARDRLQVWWLDSPREVLPAHMPVSERLLKRGLTLLRLLRLPELGAFALLVSTEKVRFPEVARLFKEEGYETLITLIAEDLKAATETSSLMMTDPRGVARILVAALQGWHISNNPTAPPTDDDCVAFVSHLVTVLITGKHGW